MSQRYEVTPGNGIVARHGDSILWVGPAVSPEVWDSLADLVTHHPGIDPLAGDTAAAIESILGPLSRVPGLSFAALLVADGQAQGVLYGPVTVRNASGPAPAHGYGPFGITIPFGLSEPIYVGFTEADSRPAPQGSQYLHLDAGVVPGSGMWMHPQARGERIYRQHGEAAPSVSSASGSHSAMTDPAPALAPQQERGAGLVIDAEQSSPPEQASPSSASGTAVPLPTFVQDALAGGVTAATGAGAASALAAAGMGAASAAPPAPSAPSTASVPATPPAPSSVEPVQPFEPVQSFDSRPAYNAPADEPQADHPADLPQADAPPADLPTDASYAHEGQSDYAPDAPPLSPPTVAATAEFTPDLGPDPAAPEPEPWSPSTEPPASVVESGFVPATDHLRIDLRLPQAGVHALPPLPPVQEMHAPAQQSPRGGVLVFDDGSTFSLDQDYVIGRKPERHALVQSGQARPLTVVDPDSVLSGAHAAVRLQGADVFLEDLGSLNGSHIALPGATEWTRVPAHNPVRLEPGTRLLFGWTVATFSGS